uniref:Zinc finger, C2H2 type n=2 Tax=Macrostomum lignano TaxID=282301 RepID=A0A1I8I880_9PLAT
MEPQLRATCFKKRLCHRYLLRSSGSSVSNHPHLQQQQPHQHRSDIVATVDSLHSQVCQSPPTYITVSSSSTAFPSSSLFSSQSPSLPSRLSQSVSSWPDASKMAASLSANAVVSMSPPTRRSPRWWPCNVCGRRFQRSDLLRRHARSHSGRRDYLCEECGQAFARSDHLATHRRKHTGEKPYSCGQCSYSASRGDMVTRHRRTIHRQAGEGFADAESNSIAATRSCPVNEQRVQISLPSTAASGVFESLRSSTR